MARSSLGSDAGFPEASEGEPTAGFGVSNLDKKNQMADDLYGNSMTMDNVAEMGEMFKKFVTKDIPKGTAKAMKVVRSGLTPGFIKRYNATKVHIEKIETRDRTLEEMNLYTKDTIARDLEAKRRQHLQNKRIREIIEARKHLREEKKVVLKEAEQTTVEQEFRAFHQRREAQLVEIKAIMAKAKQEQREREELEAQEHRRWRIGFYSEQAAKLNAEIADRGMEQMQLRRNQATLDRTFDEWEEREHARTRMQVEYPKASKPIGLEGKFDLGIFGKEHSEVLRVEKANRIRAEAATRAQIRANCKSGDPLVSAAATVSKAEATATPSAAATSVEASLKEEIIAEHHLDDNSVESEEKLHDIEDDWFIEEVDQHDVHLFTAAPYRTYEDANTVHIDKESDLKRKQQLYAALQQDSSALKQSINKLLDMKEVLERDQRQINEEIMVIEKDQHGPPRRMPNTAEIPATDGWKTQASRVFKKINDLQYALDKTQERKAAADQQALHLAKEIAVQQEQLKQHENSMSGINGTKGLLPMVVGRSLSSVPGMNGHLAQPRELFDAVTHKSRLAVVRDDADYAQMLHKEKDGIEQQIWLKRVEQTDRKIDLERMISRITTIADRLQQSNIGDKRVNLIDALRAFLASEHRLTQVFTKIVGMLPWYKHHDYRLSLSIKRFIARCPMGGISFESASGDSNSELLSNGVTLGNAKEGYCCGMVELPKNCLWSIVVTVSRQGNGEEFDSGDSSDFVSIKIGPTISSMTNVGTYFNTINPDTGTVLFDIKHLFRGKQFAFRFDFSSSSTKTQHHLCVSSGLYEEYELNDIEEVPDPKFEGRKRVLSSYVKMLRIDERSGKLRETKLLEELIDAENSPQPYWDSDLLTQVEQRYGKEYFLRILKAEILLQQQEGRKKRLEEAAEQAKVRALMVSSDVQREANMEESRKRYMMRKRALQAKKIDDGKEMLKRRLILWDEKNGSWRNITVLECLVSWVENGMVARVSHLVQEYDEGHEKLGDPIVVDLNKFKYFESPVQTVDPDVVMRWREKKRWQESINRLEDQAQQRIQQLHLALQTFKKEQSKLFRQSKRKVFAAFENTVQQRAVQMVDSSLAKRMLRVALQKVMLDIRRGLVKVDDSGDVKEQARAVARQRCIDDWIVQKRDELVRQFEENESEFNAFLEQKEVECNLTAVQIRRQADSNKAEFQEFIRQQLREKRRVLLQQMKFPAGVFERAVPQAVNCEHLKTKAWGDNYGKGVKCLVCGRELSELEKEESQIRGCGSGADSKMFEMIARHRDNEQSFRFESAEQLAAVEEERIRLEKERRLLEQQESYFYDFQDLEVVYDFDRRHARQIKADGIFRQGLQWRQDELEMFEARKVSQQKERLLEQGLPESLIENFDPLKEIQEPPPTFRAVDERHRAQYNQLVYNIGRMHNFNRRIHAFKMERFDLLSQLDVFSRVLEALHKESYVFEHTLSGIERDLDRTSKLMATFKSMQLLWQQASLIQKQAEKEKKKAEMSRVGVWDDVYEMMDDYSLLHDETRNLLRLKMHTDAKLDYEETSVQYRSEHYEKCKARYEEMHRKAAALRYCMPGNLVYTRRFGQCYITAFRPRDDIVTLLLPFGFPRAKAYIHYKEIVDEERARQHAEQLLLAREDENMRSFLSAERVQVKKERYAMQQAEQGLKRYYEFVDLGRGEDVAIKSTIDAAVQEAFFITESKKYNQLQRPSVQRQLKSDVRESKLRKREYIGPPSGRPSAMSAWQQFKHRKEIEAELKTAFIAAAASKAFNKSKAVLLQRRSAWVQQYSFELLINAVIAEMIHEVANEAFVEGRVAKGFAERKSGIVFSQPAWMQYGTYASLSSIWRQRKDALQQRIEVNRGETMKILSLDPAHKQKEKLSMEPEEVKKRKLERRRRKLEEARQQRLCAEMQREENYTRDFYRHELRLNLRERRQMREEDAAAKAVRAEQRRALEEAQRAYELLGGSAGGGAVRLTAGQLAELAAKRDNTYDRRRAELKELTLERRRREEDRALMIVEDELSRALQEIDRAERQRAAYIAEFGEPDSDEDDKDQGAESLQFYDKLLARNPRKVLPIPSWMQIPKGFRRWDVMSKNKYIRMMVSVHEKQRKIERNAAREEKKFLKIENKSRIKWDEKSKVALQFEMEAELEFMEAEEDLKAAEARLGDVRENMRRVLLYCRQKGEEELSCRSQLRKRQELARRRDKELQEASDWLDLCIRRAKNRDKLKRRVSSACRWVDTDSINGFHQRFATELLRERLYMTYFTKIVASIVNRGEIIATERKILGLQESLSVNKAHLVDRTKHAKTLATQLRRGERLRMRRSVLNEKFFAKERRAVLQQRFGGWVRFFLWNRGHKEAFQLKYEVIKRQLDIDRQFRQQLQLQHKKQQQQQDVESAQKNEPRTLMQKHRERTMQCRYCRKFYLESQNTSVLCQYHPKQFVMECPATCPNPGLTVLCASHRMRRWTCCDATKQDAAGCSRRYHAPPASDPTYDSVMRKINERDVAQLRHLDVEVEEARKHNWPLQRTMAKRQRVFEVEDDIAASRSTAERYKTLKFV